MRYSKVIAVISAVLFTSLCAMAYEFAPLGHESIGMGGAGVANADQSLAGYYNPALLAGGKGMEISVGAGLSVRENNIGKNIDDLSKMDATDLTKLFGTKFDGTAKPSFTDLQNADLIQIQTILLGFSNDNGLSVGIEGNASASFSNFAIGGFATGNAGGKAVVDKNNTDFIFVNPTQVVNGQSGDLYYKYDPANPNANVTYNLVTAGGASVDPYDGESPVGLTYDASLNQTLYNSTSIQAGLNDPTKTYIHLTGIGVVEVPLSYGTTINLPLLGKISIGASAKAMQGTTYDQRINIDTKSNDIRDQLKNVKRTSTQLGVDVGLLYKVLGLNVGVVGKNLNSPKFASPTIGGADIIIKPSYRAGVSTKILGFQFAADYDLNKAQLLDGSDVQWLGGGVKFNLPLISFLQVTAGAMSNVANPNDFGIVYTAGLQADLWICKLNVSGQMSKNKGQYNGKEFPKYSKINGSLIFNW